MLQQAKLPVGLLSQAQRERLRNAAITKLTVARCLEDIIMVVLGGPGAKSTYVPTWGGGTRAVTRIVEAD